MTREYSPELANSKPRRPSLAACRTDPSAPKRSASSAELGIVIDNQQWFMAVVRSVLLQIVVGGATPGAVFTNLYIPSPIFIARVVSQCCTQADVWTEEHPTATALLKDRTSGVHQLTNAIAGGKFDGGEVQE
jgi:hypothetical protein